jgi:putative transposase
MSIDWIPTGAVRTIHAKERGNRGVFPSNKVIGGIIEYESCLERDFFLLCHHAPDVIKFQHQPITISYQCANQKMGRYTPDVFVEFKSGKKVLIEIKYEEEVIASGNKYEERWSAAQNWGKERNIEFLVITELQIRTPRWFNIWFTVGSSKCNNLDPYLPKLIQILSDAGNHYDETCYFLSESAGIELNKSAQIVCYAIYHGLVFVDSFSTKTISNTTVIRKKKDKNFIPFKPFWEDLKREDQKRDDVKESTNDLLLPHSKDLIFDSVSFSIPQKYEEQVNAKKKIVSSWLNQPKLMRTIEWRANFCKQLKISEKTVYNWIDAYRKDGIEGLIPKHQKAGRRIKYNVQTMELMEQCRQFFFNPLISQQNAYKKLEELCKKNNVNIPKYSAMVNYIYGNSTASDFAKKRGRKYMKSNFTPSLASFQGAFAPMQIVQMDNTNLDIFPVDSEYRENLSTPYMTVAIDCYSRMITGFCVSFFPSSSQSLLDVLVQIILPKDHLVDVHGTQQIWPIKGFPVLLLVDNGMDFRSQALRDFCIKYDLIIEYAPIRTPRFKAFIEQWFNILHNALIAEDISGVRPLLKQRIENPELKPEIDAVLTLQEIETWLHKWIVDEYHFTNPYDDHSPAPFLRWQDYQEGRTNTILPLPREPPIEQKEIDLLYLSTLERAEKTLTYDGIVWHHLKYNNKEVANLYKQIGKQKIEMLLNTRDIRNIWLIPPNSSKPMKVELASGWAQSIAKLHGDRPIHASAWIKELKQIKMNLKTRISPYLYLQEVSRIQRHELLKNAEKDTRTARKEQEKIKETKRKALDIKIQPSSNKSLENEKLEENEVETDEKSKNNKKKVEIDWKNLQNFPTYKFPKER